MCDMIADLIRERRLERGMSQEDLADMVKASRTTIGNIEAGRHSPRIDLLISIGYVFGMKPSEVFGILDKWDGVKVHSAGIDRKMERLELKEKKIKKLAADIENMKENLRKKEASGKR